MIHNLTNKELDSLLKDCSSVEKEIKLADGTKKYIFKPRAMLDFKGQPASIEEFMRRTGQWNFLPAKNQEKKSVEERVQIKNAIKNWKKKGTPIGYRKVFVPGDRLLRQALYNLVEA